MSDPNSIEVSEKLPSNRSFGLVFFTLFLIIAFWPLLSGEAPRVWALIISIVFLLLSYTAQGLLTPANRLWMRFGLLLHRIISPIILGVMFYGVVLPTGLVMRVLGKDPLRLRFDRDSRSYWIKRDPPGPQPDSFRDQF